MVGVVVNNRRMVEDGRRMTEEPETHNTVNSNCLLPTEVRSLKNNSEF